MLKKMRVLKKTVYGPSFFSDYTKISEDLVLLNRHHSWKSNRHHTDVFAKHWWLFFSDNPMNTIQILSDNQWKSFQGTALFCPRFNILKWKIQPGKVQWSAYISTAPLPDLMNYEPFVFSWNSKNQFKNGHDLSNFIGKQSVVETIKTSPDPIGIALKAKKFIDRSFEEDIHLADIAKQFGYNYAVLLRAFKQSYGMGMSQYRNSLRVMNAKGILLFNNTTVLDTAISVGFSSPGGLNKAFHKVLDISPSQLQKLQCSKEDA